MHVVAQGALSELDALFRGRIGRSGAAAVVLLAPPARVPRTPGELRRSVASPPQSAHQHRAFRRIRLLTGYGGLVDIRGSPPEGFGPVSALIIFEAYNTA